MEGDFEGNVVIRVAEVGIVVNRRWGLLGLLRRRSVCLNIFCLSLFVFLLGYGLGLGFRSGLSRKGEHLVALEPLLRLRQTLLIRLRLVLLFHFLERLFIEFPAFQLIRPQPRTGMATIERRFRNGTGLEVEEALLAITHQLYGILPYTEAE